MRKVQCDNRRTRREKLPSSRKAGGENCGCRSLAMAGLYKRAQAAWHVPRRKSLTEGLFIRGGPGGRSPRNRPDQSTPGAGGEGAVDGVWWGERVAHCLSARCRTHVLTCWFSVLWKLPQRAGLRHFHFLQPLQHSGSTEEGAVLRLCRTWGVREIQQTA